MRRDNNGDWDAYIPATSQKTGMKTGWWNEYNFEEVLKDTSYKVEFNNAYDRPALVWREDGEHVCFIPKNQPADFSQWVDGMTSYAE